MTYEDNETIIDFFNAGVNGIFMNGDACHFVVGFPDWEIKDAVDYAKSSLPNKKFATPADNPFDLNPKITCPADTNVQCSAHGGTPNSDPQLASLPDRQQQRVRLVRFAGEHQ